MFDQSLTSLKSLKLRKLLDPSYFVFACLCLGPPGPYLVLLGNTGPYLALLGLPGPYLAIVVLTGPLGPYWSLLGLILNLYTN